MTQTNEGEGLQKLIDEFNHAIYMAVAVPEYSDIEPHVKQNRYYLGIAQGIIKAMEFMPNASDQLKAECLKALRITESGFIKFKDDGTPYLDSQMIN